MLHHLSEREWQTIVSEIEKHSPAWNVSRIFHLAYEQRFYTQTLDAIALHAADPRSDAGESAIPGDVLPSMSEKSR